MGVESLACSSGHTTDGRVGVHTMDMFVMDAPNNRYGALSGEVDEHGDETYADNNDEYDLDSFRQTVANSKSPDGDDLKQEMPRWQLGDEYLKSLP